MKRGSLTLVRGRTIPLLAFIEKSSELVDRDIARLRDFLARTCGIAYRRKKKNKIRRDAGPVPSVDPDLPGEIYTLW